MRSIRWRRLANPWWMLTGAIAGGLSWAVGLPVPASIGIGVIIWLTAIVVVGYVFGGLSGGVAGEAPTDADGGAGCGQRAQDAYAAFTGIADEVRSGPEVPVVERMLWRFSDTVEAIVWLEEHIALLARYKDRLAARPDQKAEYRRIVRILGEVEHRMHAGTRDLEQKVAHFAKEAESLTGSGSRNGLNAVARRLENVGYGVAIAERMTAEALDIGEPPDHFRRRR
ncbi:MAG: hypothetical protein M0026_15580 [Nocardiopsaceae bacterium]|nr:hypothetical protein [Nocardiopsaceae bacterium]